MAKLPSGVKMETAKPGERGLASNRLLTLPADT
jgi:hypothetical protein